MIGVSFGEKHSNRDFSLLLAKMELGAPEAKINKIDIEGADGSLDLTEFFGGVKYENLTHKFEFVALVPPSNFYALYSEIKNALHGKKMRIILDGDPYFYYLGRLSVSSFTSERGIGHITIEADCEPYKYKLEKTVVSANISGSGVVTLQNGRKRAVPTITTTAAMTISFNDTTWGVSAGTFVIPDLELFEYSNTIQINGTGKITFEWQEGEL